MIWQSGLFQRYGQLYTYCHVPVAFFLEQQKLLSWDNYKVEDKSDDEYEKEVQHKITGKCPSLMWVNRF